MDPRVSLITLGVADLPRARAFYNAADEVVSGAFHDLDGSSGIGRRKLCQSSKSVVRMLGRRTIIIASDLPE